ncbi:hypothetical protein KUTeg_020269 [Tegillarca granosa]|uniref:Uncharacterized protein n=1 Tax=Tegillarca granosa TaxID=220873 RepID=A0ABQ9E7K0_TEGGR|nr:hypothetical protein KUTeg_020269 [Tegillarca granosa]
MMSSKESAKKLQLVFDSFEKKQQEVRTNLRKIEDAKREKDAKPIMENLYEQLKETMDLCEKVNKEMTECKDDVGKKLGKKEEKKEDKKESEGPEKIKKSQLTPEEQEVTYELKAQLMRNVEMQNQKLKTELQLHEKMTEAKHLNQQNRRLQSDATLSRANTLKLMKMFEKKAKDADMKFKEIQQELSKSQEMAKKYQQLYEMERRKMGGNHSDGSAPQSPKSDGRDTPKMPHPTSYSFLGNSVRVNDVIRKNEVLIEENENLKREIQRLKQDNASLLKKAKVAMSDKDQVLHRLDTSESSRRELSKRLDKERNSYNTLSKSLQRQASDWILLKKQLAQFDEEYRWSQFFLNCYQGLTEGSEKSLIIVHVLSKFIRVQCLCNNM